MGTKSKDVKSPLFVEYSKISKTYNMSTHPSCCYSWWSDVDKANLSAINDTACNFIYDIIDTVFLGLFFF